MKIRILNIFFILAFIISSAIASDHSKARIAQLVEKDIYKYFGDQYGIPVQDINIGFRRIPNVSDENQNKQLQLINPKGTYEPGYQTIWLEIYENGFFAEKQPVSIDITVNKKVIIAKTKIDRGQFISDDLIEIVKLPIKSGLNNVISTVAEIYNRESTQFIKEGSIITNVMVRFPPVLKRGDKVTIRIDTGKLSLSIPGITKEEGGLGEEIQVICESTGKRFEGVIQSPGLIVVSNKGY